jgi:hypothetical protein
LLTQWRHRRLKGLHAIALLSDFEVRHRSLADQDFNQTLHLPDVIGNGRAQTDAQDSGI